MTEPQAEVKLVDIGPILSNYTQWGSPETLLALTGFDSIDNPPLDGFDKTKTLTVKDVVIAHLVSDPRFIDELLKLGQTTIPWSELKNMGMCLAKVINVGGWLVTRPSIIVTMVFLAHLPRWGEDDPREAKRWKDVIHKFWLEDVASIVPDLNGIGVRSAACTFPDNGTSSRALVMYANGHIGFAPNPSPALVMSHWSDEEIRRLASTIGYFVGTGEQLLDCVEGLFKIMDEMEPIRVMPALTMQEEFIHYLANFTIGASAMQMAVNALGDHRHSIPMLLNIQLIGKANRVLEKLEIYRAKRVELTKLVNPPPPETQPAPEGAS